MERQFEFLNWIAHINVLFSRVYQIDQWQIDKTSKKKKEGRSSRVMSVEKVKQQFQIFCASRGFHVYINLWKPKLGQILEIRQEVGNVHDPFCISIGANIPGRLTN